MNLMYLTFFQIVSVTVLVLMTEVILVVKDVACTHIAMGKTFLSFKYNVLFEEHLKLTPQAMKDLSIY